MFRNKIALTLVGDSKARLTVMTLPAAEKSLWEGVSEAGMQSTFRASNAVCGNYELLAFHHSRHSTNQLAAASLR